MFQRASRSQAIERQIPLSIATRLPCSPVEGNSGPGIPAEGCERTFEKFRQVDSSITRPKGGTGLGLAIAREIVEIQLPVLNRCDATRQIKALCRVLPRSRSLP